MNEKGNVMVHKRNREKKQKHHEVSKGFYLCKPALCEYCSDNAFLRDSTKA